MTVIKTMASSEPVIKPLDSIQSLMAAFSPYAIEVKGRGKNSELFLCNSDNEMIVLLLIEGVIDCHRKIDNLLFASVEAPGILGLQGSAFRYASYEFTCTQESKILALPLEKAINLIYEHRLLHDLINYQSYLSDYHAQRINILVNRSNYEIICGLIIELDKIPLEKRRKTSLSNYILLRSNLARSGVMAIISALRTGEYIKIENGKLIGILKKFPDKY